MMALTLLALIVSTASSDPVKTDSVATTPAPGTGPLDPGSWGLGFRVYGFAPEIRVRRAVSDRLSIGVDASWNGDYDEDKIRRTGTSWSSNNSTYTQSEYESIETQEQSNSSFRIGIPIEWIIRCRGALCVVGSAGPVYTLNAWENQSDLPGGNGSNVVGRFSTSRSIAHEVGATGSIGVRWEFLPGLALASSFGADAWYSFGDKDDQSSSASMYPTSSESHLSSTGFGTRSRFCGIGLDAWF